MGVNVNRIKCAAWRFALWNWFRSWNDFRTAKSRWLIAFVIVFVMTVFEADPIYIGIFCGTFLIDIPVIAVGGVIKYLAVRETRSILLRCTPALDEKEILAAINATTWKSAKSGYICLSRTS